MKLTPGAGAVVDGEEEEVADLLAVVGEAVAVGVAERQRNFWGKFISAVLLIHSDACLQ